MKSWMKMIGSYATGEFPRPKELIGITRAYDRERVNESELEKAFEGATLKVVKAQSSAGFSYVLSLIHISEPTRPY